MSSSMREFDRVEDRLRQHRQVEVSPIILVEGPTDILLLKQHISPNLIFVADGKGNALRAVNALHNWGISGVRAVVDADFDEASSVQYPPGVLFYEKRDLEGMLISFGVLGIVLEHQGSAAKIRKAGGATDLVERLIQAAMAVAEIRWANARESWGLRFDSVDLSSKVDRRTLRLNLNGYVAALVQASDTIASIDDVLGAVSGGNLDGRGPRGRDAVAIAGVALRSKVGSLPVAAVGEEVLSGQLRSSAAFMLETSTWMMALRDLIREAEEEIAV